jgi:uncharacterized protein (DUF1499 family)
MAISITSFEFTTHPNHTREYLAKLVDRELNTVVISRENSVLDRFIKSENKFLDHISFTRKGNKIRVTSMFDSQM